MLTGLAAEATRRARLRRLASVAHLYPGWGDAVGRGTVAELHDAVLGASAA
jgi:hypothetical protein